MLREIKVRLLELEQKVLYRPHYSVRVTVFSVFVTVSSVHSTELPSTVRLLEPKYTFISLEVKLNEPNSALHTEHRALFHITELLSLCI